MIFRKQEIRDNIDKIARENFVVVKWLSPISHPLWSESKVGSKIMLFRQDGIDFFVERVTDDWGNKKARRTLGLKDIEFNAPYIEIETPKED